MGNGQYVHFRNMVLGGLVLVGLDRFGDFLGLVCLVFPVAPPNHPSTSALEQFRRDIMLLDFASTPAAIHLYQDQLFATAAEMNESLRQTDR